MKLNTLQLSESGFNVILMRKMIKLIGKQVSNRLLKDLNVNEENENLLMRFSAS